MTRPVSYGAAPIDWLLIPEHMVGGLRRYIEDGIKPGSFLCAVLTNDLRGSVECADSVNMYRLPNYIRFLHNYAPYGSWGSVEAFNEWSAHKGLRTMGWTAEFCRE
jgi:hypothetical protein